MGQLECTRTESTQDGGAGTHTSAEIAGQLGLSAKTVENYRHVEWKSSVCEREPHWRGLQCKKN